MMVTLYVMKLISCILEFDKIYGFINTVLFLSNLNYRSERKVTESGSIGVIRKMPETPGKHIPKSIIFTETA